GLRWTSTAASARSRQDVALDELLVAGENHVACAASRRKRGSCIPSSGMLTSPPSRTSLMSRSSDDFLTAPLTSALAPRKNLWRFSRLLLPGFSRRSTMCMTTFSLPSAGLFHAHVPLDEPPDLPLSIAAFNHSRDKLAVLLFGLTVLLRTERDDRQE